MDTNKKEILEKILFFIETGDELIESIDSFLYEAEEAYSRTGYGNKNLFERALKIEVKYTQYMSNVYSAVSKYGLNKIQESAFKPSRINKIRGGESVVRGYIDIPSTKGIFESMKYLITATKNGLREVSEKISEPKKEEVYLVDNHGVGFLNINNKRTMIGASTHKPFLLLKLLLDNLGTTLPVGYVLEKIGYTGSYSIKDPLEQERRLRNSAIKDLQKNNKMKGNNLVIDIRNSKIGISRRKS